MSTTLVRLCGVDDVAAGMARRVSAPGYEPLAVVRLGDAWHVIADTCTHGMASLSEGDIEDGQIFCPFHGGAFDIATGAPTERPCVKAIATYPAVVVDGAVHVEARG